mgnify:CR=1 FL=1
MASRPMRRGRSAITVPRSTPSDVAQRAPFEAFERFGARRTLPSVFAAGRDLLWDIGLVPEGLLGEVGRGGGRTTLWSR